MKPEILDSDVRIGDRVLVSLGKSESGWFTKQKEETRKGIVCGHYVIRVYYGRNACPAGLIPGGYWYKGAPVIQLDVAEGEDSNQVRIVGMGELSFLHISDSEIESRKADLIYKRAFAVKHRFSDLPDLPYYEGDVVFIKDRSLPFHGQEAIITKIDYSTIVKHKRAESNDVPIYTVKSTMITGKEYVVAASSFDLVRHGNYYWFERDATRLSFTTIRDELEFYLSVNMLEKLADEHSGQMVWGRQRALAMVKEGRADVVVSASPMTDRVTQGIPATVFVYRFLKPSSVSLRFREATLSGRMDFLN